jgi:erythronate-4-phosphate dehydrogenase
MKLVADENIPFIKQAFAHLGEVATLPGRQIKHENLIDADVLLVRSVTEVNQELLESTSIKFVATATSGINHIDAEYLKSNNIGFASALGSNAISVAQYVISAICYWSIQKDKPLESLSLGIIGCGNVGGQLKKLCDSLNIKTVLNDPPLAEKKLDSKIKYSSIQQALVCDIVSLHVPFTTEGKYATQNLINKQSISQLKPNGLFINSSRGEVVDEPELLDFSKSNNTSLVLDVWQNEPNINFNNLAQTLIGTPHIAGYSYDGKIRGTEMIYQACCEYFNILSQWSKNDVDFGDNKADVINLSGANDIRKELLGAYNILSDDQQLKRVLHNQQESLGNYFDGLRKNYPIRREWSFIENSTS